MKKALISTLILCALTMAAGHAENKAEALVIELASGETATFILEERPRLTFTGEELTITSGDYETSYPLASLQRYTFKFAESSGITQSADKSQTITQTAGHIRLDGLSPGTQIKTFSVNGILVASDAADSNGSATISVSNLPKGVYIIKYGDKSTKIKKQ